MKSQLTITFIPILGLLLTSCGGIAPSSIGKSTFEENGFTAYIPPQGNPSTLRSWNYQGPGAIIRRKDYLVDYVAQNYIGKDSVQQVFQRATGPVETRETYGALSNKKTAASNFDASGGWTTAKVLEIKGQLGLSDETTEDIQFGNTWVEQVSLQDIKKAPGRKSVDQDVRLNLRQGVSQLVVKTIYTDSISIYFKKAKNNSAGASLVIPAQDAQKLSGSYKVTNDGGVQVKGPIMIGYIPLPKEDANSLFPKK